MIRKTMTAAMVLALGASLAFAGPGEGKSGKRHGKHGKHGEAHMARLAEKLNLTDAQKQQMKEQRENFRASNEHRFQTYRDTMRQYREARKAGDTARAEQLKSALELQRGELNQLRETQHQAMLSILTPEQRAQLDTMKNERQERRRERRERRQSQQ